MAACGSSTSSNSPSNSGSGGGTPSPSPTPSSIDVTTYHYDNLRTGQNLTETTLTLANVNQAKFGKVGELMVDGKVDGQPLYLSQVAMPGVGTKNVLYVATEHGSVFAFDADTVSGTSAKPLWQISTQLPGESPSDDRGCGQVTPEIGITSTPVIDRARGAIYVWRRSNTNLRCHLPASSIIARTLARQLRGNLPQRLGRRAAYGVGIESEYASMFGYNVENILCADARHRDLR